jgi:hypothetical protein
VQEEGENVGSEEELTKKFLKQFAEEVRIEHEEVVKLGGLHVLPGETPQERFSFFKLVMILLYSQLIQVSLS